MFDFYTHWKRQKTQGFLTFSGGIEMEIGVKRMNVKFQETLDENPQS